MVFPRIAGQMPTFGGVRVILPARRVMPQPQWLQRCAPLRGF